MTIYHDFGTILFYLIVGHALADYPLQGDFLATAKNRNTTFGMQGLWVHALFSHSMIHAGFVALITGQVWIGLLEAVAHALTDFLKCEGRLSFHTDQAAHIACKFVWAALAVYLWSQP